MLSLIDDVHLDVDALYQSVLSARDATIRVFFPKKNKTHLKNSVLKRYQVTTASNMP